MQLSILLTVIITLPPYGSHRMQPLDVSFINPLNLPQKQSSQVGDRLQTKCIVWTDIYKLLFQTQSSMALGRQEFTR